MAEPPLTVDTAAIRDHAADLKRSTDAADEAMRSTSRDMHDALVGWAPGSQRALSAALEQWDKASPNLVAVTRTEIDYLASAATEYDSQEARNKAAIGAAGSGAGSSGTAPR